MIILFSRRNTTAVKYEVGLSIQFDAYFNAIFQRFETVSVGRRRAAAVVVPATAGHVDVVVPVDTPRLAAATAVDERPADVGSCAER